MAPLGQQRLLGDRPATLPLSSRAYPDFLLHSSQQRHFVVLRKENHIQSTEAATLDRKSGEADLSRRAVEGPAVLSIPNLVLRKAATLGLSSRLPRRAVGAWQERVRGSAGS
jgi:hypothetical protein